MATLVISYSRTDQTLVRAVVALLKTALRDVEKAVFWDADIEPGDEWWEELQHHIEEAPQLFVFWCLHSSQSNEVRREFSYALQRGKRVVPVLLDNTPLSAELAPINGIDLRQAVLHGQPPPPVLSAPARRASSAWLTVALSGVFAAAVLVSAFLLRAPAEAPPTHPNVPEAPSTFPSLVPVFVLVLIALGAWLLRRLEQRREAQEWRRVRESLAPSVLDPDATVAAFSAFVTPSPAHLTIRGHAPTVTTSPPPSDVP